MRYLAVAAALLLPMAAQAQDASVTIDNFRFTPAEVIIAVGDAVVWTNRDDTIHQVVESRSPRRIASPPLDTDDSYRFVFRTPGTYRYFCALHPHMQGTVVVR